MTTVTFYAPKIHARKVQNLVKKYGGYFAHNPFDMFSGEMEFKINFEDSSNCNKFMIRTHIINQSFF